MSFPFNHNAATVSGWLVSSLRFFTSCQPPSPELIFHTPESFPHHLDSVQNLSFFLWTATFSVTVDFIIVPSCLVTKVPFSNVTYLHHFYKASIVSACILPKFVIVNFKDLFATHRHNYALWINCVPPPSLPCLQPPWHVQEKLFIVPSPYSYSHWQMVPWSNYAFSPARPLRW